MLLSLPNSCLSDVTKIINIRSFSRQRRHPVTLPLFETFHSESEPKFLSPPESANPTKLSNQMYQTLVPTLIFKTTPNIAQSVNSVPRNNNSNVPVPLHSSTHPTTRQNFKCPRVQPNPHQLMRSHTQTPKPTSSPVYTEYATCAHHLCPEAQPAQV